MKLYDLVGIYNEILEDADNPEFDVDSLTDALAQVSEELEDKADNIAKLIKQLTAEGKALKEEAERLSARAKARDTKVKWLKSYLEGAMVATGKTKFKTELFSFGIQKNTPALKVDDVPIEIIPVEYLTYPEPVVNKELVKEAIKEGTEFSWARLEQSESIRIR